MKLSSFSALTLILIASKTFAARPPAPAPVPVSAPAPAPPPAPPPVPTLAQTLTGDAKADYDSAILLYQNSDYANAVIKFQSAYRSAHDVRLLWNEAACEKNLHHYARVAALLKQYLAEGKGVLSEQDQQDAQSLLQTIEPFISRVTIVVDQPDASVAVDGNAIGKAPLSEPIALDVGPHKIAATKEGYVDVLREQLIEGGHPTSVSLVMKAVVHEGRLVVNAPLTAAVYIDGKVSGTGPWDGTLPSGAHDIHVTQKGMLPYDRKVVLQDGETRTSDVVMQAQPTKGVPAWIWITGSVVVAGGLATGGYFLFKPKPGPEVDGTMTPGTIQLSSQRF